MTFFLNIIFDSKYKKFVSLGTKEIFEGPMELVEALRAALVDEPVPQKPLKTIPDGPGDKPQGDTSFPEAENKREDSMKKKRRKMP